MTLYLSGKIGEQFQVWELEEARVGVGRSSKNAIHVPDGTVSKDHAEITRKGDQYFLRDLGSRNGTRVNGVEAKDATQLKSGDRVEIGHLMFRVTADHPHQPTVLSPSAGISSKLKIKAEQILDRKVVPPAEAANIVHLLAEAGRLLILPRPLKETCDEILKFVERAVPASRLILMLREETDEEPVQIAARYRGGNATEPLVLSKAIMHMVLGENTSVLTTDASADPRFNQALSIVSQAVHSAMAVPLYDNEKVLGILYADQNNLTISFTEEHLEILTLLANMAAVKITNARLLEAEQGRMRVEQELATATRIQRSLLPAELPVVDGYRFQAFLETCYEVGGDLYDFHRKLDGTVFFMLGDVSGKGMGAAILMSSTLASARVLYDQSSDPAQLMTRLNDVIYRSTDRKHFVTAFAAGLDPTTGTLRYVNAGHPPPFLVAGTEVRELASNGVPLGVMPDFPFASDAVELKHGELLAVFSDGIPEAQRGDEFFEDKGLSRALVEEGGEPDLEELARKVIGRVDAFLAGTPRGDDITLLLLRRQ